MRIGYARISRIEQNLDLQMDALKKDGCETIFTDEMTGSKFDRPGLSQLLEYVRKGDSIVIWRLDRLGRSLKDLIQLVSDFRAKGIELRSLHESLDTCTASGKLMFHVFGALAEFERNLMIERTHAGLEAARARGRQGGRPRKLSAEKIALLKELYFSKKHHLTHICDLIGISKPTLYSYIRR